MPNKIGTTRRHWFMRGFAGGFLLIAAANAASYFIRSNDLGAMFGSKESNNGREALGFPFEIWRSGETYGGWMLDYATLPWNLLVGILLGCALGAVAVAGRQQFNQWVAEFESQQSDSQLRLQFSVKGMLIATTALAVVFAATTTWGSSPQLLGAIYFLGPLCLISIAMAPDRIPWQYRAVVLTFVATAMIGIAIRTGWNLKMNAEQVLLGIFVSWTPQSAFVAAIILLAMMWIRLRARADTSL